MNDPHKVLLRPKRLRHVPSRLLRLDPLAVSAARDQRLAADLVAYLKPHYQVLSLPAASTPPSSQLTGQVASVGDILRRVLQAGGTR